MPPPPRDKEDIGFNKLSSPPWMVFGRLFFPFENWYNKIWEGMCHRACPGNLIAWAWRRKFFRKSRPAMARFSLVQKVQNETGPQISGNCFAFCGISCCGHAFLIWRTPAITKKVCSDHQTGTDSPLPPLLRGIYTSKCCEKKGRRNQKGNLGVCVFFPLPRIKRGVTKKQTMERGEKFLSILPPFPLHFWKFGEKRSLSPFLRK